jgi:hypothetical protein
MAFLVVLESMTPRTVGSLARCRDLVGAGRHRVFFFVRLRVLSILLRRGVEVPL